MLIDCIAQLVVKIFTVVETRRLVSSLQCHHDLFDRLSSLHRRQSARKLCLYDWLDRLGDTGYTFETENRSLITHVIIPMCEYERDKGRISIFPQGSDV